jgi:PAS domain S-box-containing protein
MAEKPTYKELEQRIKELEKEASELKQAKEALKESEQKYRHLTESLLDTVYEFDREGRFTYVNEAGTHMFGYSKQEILNSLRVQDTMVEEVRDLSQRAISEIFKGNTTVGERTFLRKDGSQFIGEIHSGPIYKGEEVVGVRGMLRDITTSKQAEEALLESEKKYRDLVENISDVIYFTNENGVMTYISPAIESV